MLIKRQGVDFTYRIPLPFYDQADLVMELVWSFNGTITYTDNGE
jgi:hypothetical protein